MLFKLSRVVPCLALKYMGGNSDNLRVNTQKQGGRAFYPETGKPILSAYEQSVNLPLPSKGAHPVPLLLPQFYSRSTNREKQPKEQAESLYELTISSLKLNIEATFPQR